jgi:lipoate-protein ligase A
VNITNVLKGGELDSSLLLKSDSTTASKVDEINPEKTAEKMIKLFDKDKIREEFKKDTFIKELTEKIKTEL